MSGSNTPVASPDALDGAARGALRRHILTLADSKRILGIRYSDWALGGPSIESSVATSSMAQDEWGHARLLYAMLKAWGDDPKEVEHDREPDAYTSLPALDRPQEDWAELVAAMLVVDSALTVALEGFSGGLFEPARSRVPKMVAEEAFHLDLARAWYKRLARGTDEGRSRLESASRSILPGTLAWLAPADDAFRALVDAGLTHDGQTLVGEFWDRCGGSLELVGVEAISTEPDREGWDDVRGRGPGHPGEEAVERARGARNRALLVE
ncbi:MAG TPA: Phenylacetic acid catabolic protein [Longimicrobiales bacterium]